MYIIKYLKQKPGGQKMSSRQFLGIYSTLTVLYVVIITIGPALVTSVTSAWTLIGLIVMIAASMLGVAVIRADTLKKPWYWSMGTLVPGWNLYFLVELGK